MAAIGYPICPSVIRCVPSGLALLDPMKFGRPPLQPANITTWLYDPSPGTLKQTTSPGFAFPRETCDQRPSWRRFVARPLTLSLCSQCLIWPAFSRHAETKFAQLTLLPGHLSRNCARGPWYFRNEILCSKTSRAFWKAALLPPWLCVWSEWTGWLPIE